MRRDEPSAGRRGGVVLVRSVLGDEVRRGARHGVLVRTAPHDRQHGEVAVSERRRGGGGALGRRGPPPATGRSAGPPRTTGSTARLRCPSGGEVVAAHSSVVACHSFSSAFLPKKML